MHGGGGRRRGLLRRYLGLVGLQAIGAVLAAAFLALVAIAVAPEVFGAFSLALSVAQVVAAIGLAWTNAALLRYAREEVAVEGTIGANLGSRLLIHAVLLVVIVPALILLREPLEAALGLAPGAFGLILAALVVISMFEMGAYAAQAVERFSAYGVGPVVLKAVQIATLGLFVLGVAEDWQALMIGTIVGYALALVLAWGQIPARAYGRVRATGRQLKRILAYSWSLPIGAAGGVLVIWMDLWFLRFFLDLDAVGVYAWAYNISLFASALFVPLGAIVAPRVLDMRVANDAPGLRRYARTAAALYFLAASLLPAALAVVIALFWLADMGRYQAALAPLLVLLVATLFQFANYLINPVLAAYERLVPVIVAISLVIAALNGAGNWLLIGPLGLLGPALATVGAFAVGTLLALSLARRATPAADGFAPSAAVAAGTACIGVAIAVAFAPPAVGLTACLLIAALATLAARRAGAYRGIGEIASLTGGLPAFAAAPVRRALLWLDNGPTGPRPGHG